jgi:two-component system sensor histidine kinase DegS
MEKRDILLMQETERRRIAEELHDTTVQDMIHLSQELELALFYLDKDLTQSRLEIVSSRKQIKNIINGMRETIYDLRPMTFDDIGWDASFTRLKDKLCSSKPEMNVIFDVDNIDISDGVVAISIYRIVYEACRNIIKHSSADNVSISVKQEDNFVKINIDDDGIGFDSDYDKNTHFGLEFMKERVALLSGEITITADDNNIKGTHIDVSIPL